MPEAVCVDDEVLGFVSVQHLAVLLSSQHIGQFSKTRNIPLELLDLFFERGRVLRSGIRPGLHHEPGIWPRRKWDQLHLEPYCCTCSDIRGRHTELIQTGVSVHL